MKRIHIKILSLSFLLSAMMIGPVFSSTISEGDAIIGIWLTQDKDGKIEIYKKGDRYYGKLVWGNKLYDEKGNLRLDNKNPEKSLRTRPLKGLVLLRDFIYTGDNEWEKGKIYDPKSGKTYSCVMELHGNELEVTGYVGFSWIGRTVKWTKVK